MNHFVVSLLVCALPVAALAQPTPPTQWHHLDPLSGKAIGISTERAYELLKTAPASRLPAQPPKPVIVAVIDGGIAQNHEDLKSVLWTNPSEIAGNGKDDDGNGYADDLNGWNFHGGKDGRNMEHEQKEETRLYARLKAEIAQLKSQYTQTVSRLEARLKQGGNQTSARIEALERAVFLRSAPRTSSRLRRKQERP
jgi:hypothetical protein